MQKDTRTANKLSINPFDVLVLLLILISFFSLLLLSFDAFSVDIALILAGMTLMLIALLSRNTYVLTRDLFHNKDAAYWVSYRLIY